MNRIRIAMLLAGLQLDDALEMTMVLHQYCDRHRCHRNLPIMRQNLVLKLLLHSFNVIVSVLVLLTLSSHSTSESNSESLEESSSRLLFIMEMIIH